METHPRWAAGPHGARLWGGRGAAGLALVTRGGEILMQHRAEWTSDGDTWALPGGAIEEGETPVAAAAREAEEETGVPASAYAVQCDIRTAGPYPADPDRPELAGGWTYTTVIAIAPERVPLTPNNESVELRWVRLDEVEHLQLMPAFAESWPRVRAHIDQCLVC